MASRVQAGGPVSVVDETPLLADVALSVAERAEQVQEVAEQASDQREQIASEPRRSLASRCVNYLGNLNPRCFAIGCAAATAMSFVGMALLSRMAGR